MIKSVDLTTGMCRVIEYMYELMVPGYRMGTSVTRIRAEKESTFLSACKIGSLHLILFFYTFIENTGCVPRPTQIYVSNPLFRSLFAMKGTGKASRRWIANVTSTLRTLRTCPPITHTLESKIPIHRVYNIVTENLSLSVS